LVAGYSTPENSFRADGWLIKFDPITGEKVWQKTYGSKHWDEITSIIETSDGHLMALGWRHVVRGKKTDIWLMRLDLDGKVMWEKLYGNKRWDEGYSIVEMKDGNFAISGYVNNKKEDDDIYVLKVNKMGEELWAKKFGDEGRDRGEKIYSLSNGDVLAIGFTGMGRDRKEDAWVARLSSEGEPVWKKSIGGDATDILHDVLELPNGNLLLIGFTRSHSKNKQADMWLVKLNAAGEQLLEKTYGYHKFEKGRRIIPTRDGGFAIAALTYSKGMGKSDLWFVKLDKNLEIAWQEICGGDGNEVARSLIELEDGSIIIAGKIDLPQLSAFLLVRYELLNRATY